MTALVLPERPRLLLPPGAAGVYTPPTPQRTRYEDSTRLKDLIACPQRYKYKHIDGWSLPPSASGDIDLWFGGAFGAGVEAYWKGIIEHGYDCDTALRRAIRLLLSAGWDDVANGPRYGRYASVWRCLGLEKYKNAAGRPAKCPFSHKGKFYPAPGPTTCSCGSPTASSVRWFPDNPAKDRVQLVRALVWYAEETKAQPLAPISMGTTLADGTVEHKALCEVPFRFPLAVIDGTQFVLVGWWDALMQAGQDGQVWIVDFKSTKHTLNADYFSQYQPNYQIDLYDAVGRAMLPTMDGVGIYAMQVGADRTGEGWVRFAFKPFIRSDIQREEFMREVTGYCALASTFERLDHYPMNRTSCKFCEFKPVCNTPAPARKDVLAQSYVRRVWNPLTRQQETHNAGSAEENTVFNLNGSVDHGVNPGAAPGPSSGASGEDRLADRPDELAA